MKDSSENSSNDSTDQRKKILIVEDEFIIGQDIQSTLEGFGYEVPTVLSTADQIVQKTKEINPDLILMDVNLGGDIDGIEAADLIRSECHVPLLFLTSYTDEKTINRAKLTDPFGYIIKPFQQNELKTAIEMALHKAKIERQLRESQEWLATVLRSIDDGVIAVDQAGIITFMNPVAEQLVGVDQKQLQGKHFDVSVLLKNERQGVQVKSPLAEVIDLGNSVRIGNLVLIAKKGNEIPIEESWTPMLDRAGMTTGAVLVFRDLREKRKQEARRRELEEQILHVQKLESIGVLAGGIAHDFNNLLCIILGNSSLAREEGVNLEFVLQKMKLIETTSLRASELIKQLLSYSGKGKPMMQVVNLAHVVGEMGTLLQASISKKVELEYQFGEDLPSFFADAGQIRQIVMNLIINASDALCDQRGKVTLKTSMVDLMKEGIPDSLIGQDILPGKHICLEVSDTGPGMDAETRSKLFDPFFTTKHSGRGLGLAVVLGIVRAHSGAISLVTAPGKGASFKIYFPAGHLSQKLTPTQETQVILKPSAQGGTILVVDDEGQILTIARAVLEKEGFNVLTAENGLKGLELFEESSNEISAVLLDMSMPDLDGAETLAQMRRISPDVKVLLSSGYHEEEIISRLAAYSVKCFLQKPYRPGELVEKLYEALDG